MSNSPPTQSQENKQGKNLRGNFTVEEFVSSDQLLIKNQDHPKYSKCIRLLLGKESKIKASKVSEHEFSKQKSLCF